MTTSAPRLMEAGTPISEIDVVVSDRAQEIDEALTLVHDGFVEAGYMQPTPSGRRLHLSYLNPGTAFYVARIDGECVGTCAMIADGPFGLPSDRAFAEENDAMRAEGLGLLHECGSLAVAHAHRRHTRRIVTRVVAAMARIACADYPTAPVPMAVAPENLRFYEALVGARQVAEARPLYGAPAILLRTGGPPLAAHAAQRATPIQRTMDALVTDPEAAWLTDHRTGRPPSSEWLAPLLEESPAFRRFEAQAALLADARSAPAPAREETAAGAKAA